MTSTQYRATTDRYRRVVPDGKWALVLLLLGSPLSVSAQTWAGNRARPSASEIAAVDRTGEANWLWGAEDVAGDGQNQFTGAEQAIDARSVYVRVDASRLWWRTYLSATAAPENNLTAYLFVDSDLNASTGLSAAAPAIDQALAADVSAGGYEYVISVRGDGSQPVLWERNAQGTAFVEVPATANQLDAEAGLSLDPLRIGADDHGYVQASIARDSIGVNSQCQARFYVRTTNQTQALGVGDLEVGEVISCTPADTDQDLVPDLLEPNAECRTDDQCPNAGICWNGVCWLAPVCVDDADCPANFTCVNGSCVATTGTECRVDSDCITGICENGQCVLCTSDADCAPGQACGPDGRCVDEDVAGPGAGGSGNSGTNVAGTSGVYLLEGERIQGGPCACRYVSDGERSQRLGWLAAAAGLFVWHTRRRREREQAR